MTDEQFASELVKLKPLERWKFIFRHRPFDIVFIVVAVLLLILLVTR